MGRMLDKFLGKPKRSFTDSGGPLQFSATQDRVASLEKQVCSCDDPLCAWGHQVALQRPEASVL